MSVAAAQPVTLPPAVGTRERSLSTGKVAGVAFVWLVYCFLYAPIVVMVIFSFNAGTIESLPLKGFSTTWYQSLASDSAMIKALLFSLRVSVTAVVISVIAGTSFSLLFIRVRLKGMPVLQALIALPFVMPGMVLGISLLLSLRVIGIGPGYPAILIAHITFITPLIVFVVSQRLRALDPALEQASMDLGAGPMRTFVHVIFPSIRTAMIAAALLGFTVSFDEVIITFFVTGFQETLPVHIWTLLRHGFTPAINAILTIIAAFSVSAITVSTVILTRTRKGAAR